MANYSLVVGSKFSPFTYQELLEPAVSATKAHQELENQYSELSTKASVWEGLANEQTDPEAYDTYKAYSDELKKQADLLASQGLSIGSRKAIADLKSRYSSDIVPIENAYKKRQSLIEQQREALLRDDTLMFDTDYSTTSLDTLIKNPNASFTPLSGESIVKRTAAMAKEAARTMLSDPEYKPVFNSQYVQQKIMQGYDISQIIAAAQRDPNAPKALLGIVDAIKGQVGYDKWSNDNKKKIDSYINEGLDAAVGTPKIDVMSNRNFESDIDIERMELAREQFELQEKQFEYETKGIKQPDGSYYKPLGGGRILHTKPDGTSTIIGITSEEEEDAQDMEKNLASVTKVSDMKEKNPGFIPVAAVVKSNGIWVGGREREDIPEHTIGIGLKTNLKSGAWGNFSYEPKDPHAEAYVVTNPETIPGFLEFSNGVKDISHTAFGQILEQARRAGISDEEFFSNNVQIVKVKARGRNRAKSDEPYDYLIYRKS